MKCFVLMGQSNMSGRGNLDEVEPISDEKIFMLKDGNWIKMTEPIHNDSSASGIGPAASFALNYLNTFNEEIGLIPCAVGGTSISQWQKNKNIFSDAANKISTLSDNDEIIGILWAQGETDCRIKENAEKYDILFYKMSDALDKMFGTQKVPVILADIPQFFFNNNAYKFSNVVSEKIKTIAQSSKRFGLVTTDGLTSKEDGLHYNSASCRELGRRFFDAYYKLITKGDD